MAHRRGRRLHSEGLLGHAKSENPRALRTISTRAGGGLTNDSIVRLRYECIGWLTVTLKERFRVADFMRTGVEHCVLWFVRLGTRGPRRLLAGRNAHDGSHLQRALADAGEDCGRTCFEGRVAI